MPVSYSQFNAPPPIDSSLAGAGGQVGSGVDFSYANPSPPPNVSTNTDPSQPTTLNGLSITNLAPVSVKAPPSTASGQTVSTTQDFTDRQGKIAAGDRAKISLVGKTGAGAKTLAGDSGSGVAASMSVVTFKIAPDMTESGSTIIIDIGDIRAAASINFYMGSPGRTFSLTARFLSRTADEAAQTMHDVNILKAWRMPTLNKGNGNDAEPETLKLYAYQNVLKGIPVMMSSITVEYSSEVDYVLSNDSNWVPIVQTVTMQLKEVRSSDDLDSFDYTTFKEGKLNEW